MSGYFRRVISQRAAGVVGTPKHEPMGPIAANPATAKELLPGPPMTINPQAAPQRHFKVEPLGAALHKWIDFHNPLSGGPLLVTDSALYVYNADWKPLYWLVHVSGTAGYVNIHNGSGRAPHYVRIPNGTAIRYDGRGATLTIETVGFSGFYDVYGTDSLEDFQLMA